MTGTYNAFMGSCAGYNNTVSNNLFVGSKAGYSTFVGQQRTFIGYQAGYTTTGKGNIFFGTAACTQKNPGPADGRLVRPEACTQDDKPLWWSLLAAER